jgi:hypothetical protein
MSEHLAPFLVPILNSSSILGHTFPNIIADKLGRFNVMIVMSAFTSIQILAFWLPSSSNAAIVVFAILFGVGSGAGIGLTPALCASIARIGKIGVYTGIALLWQCLRRLPGVRSVGRLLRMMGVSLEMRFCLAGVVVQLRRSFLGWRG